MSDAYSRYPNNYFLWEALEEEYTSLSLELLGDEAFFEIL